jgi:CheY-like chemotaxis protein
METRGVSLTVWALPLPLISDPKINIDNNMIIDVEALATHLPQNFDESPAAAPGDGQRFEEYLALGIKSAQAGDRVKARTLLTAAADLNPESESAWLWLASISEYPEELLVFLNHVLQINPHNERALSWNSSTKALMSKTLIQRGIDASTDGRREAALECFDQAIEFDARNEAAWLWMAKLAESEQRKIELLERVLAINPENADAKATVQAAHEETRDRLLDDARRAAAAGNYTVSKAFLNELLTKFPDNEAAWELRSHVVSDLGERAAAYEMLLALNPDNALAAAGLVSLKPVLAAMPVIDPKEDSTENVTESSDELEVPTEIVSVDDDAILEFSGTDELSGQDIENIVTGDLVFPEDIDSFGSEASMQSEDSAIESEPKDFEVSEEVADDDATEEWVASPVQESTEQCIEEESVAAEDHDETPAYFAAAPVEPLSHAEVTAYVEAAPAVENEESSPWNDFADETPESVDGFSEVTEEVPAEQSPVIEASDHLPAEDSDDAFAETAYDEISAVETYRPEPLHAGPTVLVVDDNPVIRKLIGGKLEESGYNVVCAEDGRSAAAMIKGAAPQMVLLDITLPKMDGYEVCRSIRMNETTRNIPVIMISGKDGYYEENKGKAAGATGFITKPFGPETLMRTVETYLQGVEQSA